MGNGNCRPTLAAPRHQTVVLGSEVAVADPRCAPGGLNHRAAQPSRAHTGAPRTTLACGLVISRTKLGPRCKVGSTGKAAHVGADFDQDLLSVALPNAGDGIEPYEQSFKRAQPLLDLQIEIRNLAIQELQLVELLAKQKALVRTERAWPRRA